MALNYTNIQHAFRKKHNLSCNEYVLCDMIFYLSSNEKSSVAGWCYMSKQTISDEIGLTKRAIIGMIDRMVDSGFIERNNSTKHLRSTEKWKEVYFTIGEKTSPFNRKSGENFSLNAGEKTSSYNNNSFNNNNIDNEEKIKRSIKLKKDKLFNLINDFKKKNPEKYPNKMYDNFFKYWTEELNPLKRQKDKYIRMDECDFFSIGGRLATYRKFIKLEEWNEMWVDHEEKKKQAPDLFSTQPTN